MKTHEGIDQHQDDPRLRSIRSSFALSSRLVNMVTATMALANVPLLNM